MNILLVEDEPPILRQLEHYIHKFGEPYHIIATAFDGQTARELIDKYQDRIDYILTDIQIPMMNGLELAEYARNHYPGIICSVLTGYSDFAYVQKALRLKLLDYILKPIEEDVLQDQLKNGYEQKCLEYAKKEFITGYSAVTGFSEELSLNYRQILVNIGQFSHKTDQVTDNNTASKNFRVLETTLKTFLTRFTKYWIIGDKNCHSYFILFSFNERQLTECIPFYYDLYTAVRQHFPVITVIFSDLRITLDNINCNMQNLSKYANNKILFAQSGFIRLEDNKGGSVQNPEGIADAYTPPADSIAQLTKLFTNGSRNMFHAELYQFINRLKRHPIKQKTLRIYLMTLFTECTVPYLHYNSIRQIEPANIIDDIIMLSVSCDSLYDNLVSIFDDFFAALINETKHAKGKSDTFVQINDYIKKHFTETINTRSLADTFGFTPAYLSKLFREYKKITPSEYISRLRIDKAKELLRSNRSLSSKEVAGAAGYDDPLYFSKVFKKLVGKTPKAYQKEEGY